MNKVRWGIIGCGDVTEHKSGPAFQKAKHSELIAVMRRNRQLARDYAQRHQVPKWYDDADSLINDPEVDAVYIATPPAFHREYTLRVAWAGKPVYVEKPMACHYAECQEMIDGCAVSGVPLFVAYYRRALPRFLKIKQIIERGDIGDVRAVNVRFYRRISDIDRDRKYHWRIDPEIAGCGYFCDLGSHMIDLMQYLLGAITEVHGLSENQAGLYEVEDIVSANFKFENGELGSGIWCFTANENLDQTDIVGSKGKIRYATFGDSPFFVHTKHRYKEYKVDHPEHIQQPLIQTIVDELSGWGKCPSTGRTAAPTNWVIDQVLGRL
ncbi:MAG TPA: Gfo/Idh/MocA family oxidoreductase [Candidatus Marinimicrobia bacterium]|nr:Gfo/Idh/MocA family oxidoreductase [Candidatus Neomarinimicrobiota bacterium]